MIKVYARLDNNNVITEINSSIFLSNTEGYVVIDEGNGDKYAHAQGNYLPNGLMDNQGRYNYKHENSEVIELSEDEKSSLFPNDIELSQQVSEMSSDNSNVAIMEALIDMSNRLDKIEASLNK